MTDNHEHDFVHIETEIIYQLALSYYVEEDWSNAAEWFGRIVRQKPNYEDANSRLRDAEKQLQLAALYEQGKQAIAGEDWEIARVRFQEILEIDPDYKHAADFHNEANREIEVPQLYSRAKEQLRQQDWSKAIETLNKLLGLDPHHEEARLLLRQTKLKERLEDEYQWALKRCENAEGTDQEEDWREATTLLQKIADKQSGYKSVSTDLAYAQRRLKYFELVRKGEEHWSREEWQDAVTCIEHAVRINSRDCDLVAKLAEARKKSSEKDVADRQKIREFYDKGNDYYQLKRWGEAKTYLEKAYAVAPSDADLVAKLSEAKKNLRRQRVMKIAGVILTVVLLPLAYVMFQNPISETGDSLLDEYWLKGGGVPPTPTIAIPGIGKVEYLVNGVTVENINQPYYLIGTRQISVEARVWNTDGMSISNDEILCQWAFDPPLPEEAFEEKDGCQISVVAPEGMDHHLLEVVIRGKDLDEVAGTSRNFINIVLQGNRGDL